MAWENYLLYFTLAVYATGMAAYLLRRRDVGRALLAAASIPSVLLFLSYAYAFFANDFGLAAVFQSSSVSLPVPFKMVAALAGAGGSLLLWLAIMSVALLAYQVWSREPSTVTSLIVGFFAVFVLVGLSFINPFAQSAFSAANGLGLTPSLQSYWALIHPPTVFSAYTAMIFLFADVISRRWQKDRTVDWRPVNRKLLTLTWVLLGTGIAFGGYWSYRTEGWGGYWAWDPIETSALIPWVALSAMLLSSRMGTRLKGSYALFGTTFAASTLSFTSYVARGAGAPSVHSYGDMAAGAPFILLSLIPVVICLASLKGKGGGTGQGNGMSLVGVLEYWSVMLLAAANLVLLLAEEFLPDFGTMFAPSEQLHNMVSLPLVVAFFGLASVEGLRDRSRGTAIKAGATGAAAFAIGTAVALSLSTNGLFDVLVPASFAALGLWACALASEIAARPRGGSALSFVRLATLMGIFVLLLGVAFSSTMKTSVYANLGAGQSAGVGGNSLVVNGANTAPSVSKVYLPAYGSEPESVDSVFQFTIDGQVAAGSADLKYYPSLDQFYPVPSVYSGLAGDLYVVEQQTASVVRSTSEAFYNGTAGDPNVVSLNLQFIPGVSFVWLGAAIAILANVPAILLGLGEGRQDPKTDPVGPDNFQE